MALLAWPSFRACKQSLNGPVLESKHMRYLSHGFLNSISELNVKIKSDVVIAALDYIWPSLAMDPAVFVDS